MNITSCSDNEQTTAIPLRNLKYQKRYGASAIHTDRTGSIK